MKKIILFSFIFLLTFSLLTACGESSGTEDSVTPVTAGQESGAPSSAETEVSSEQEASPETASPSEPEQSSDTKEPSESETSSNPAAQTEADASSNPERPSEPEPDFGNADTEDNGEYSFIGTVEDVSEHEAMINVTEGDIQNYGDSVLVSFPDEIDLDVQIGDTVRVTFDGIVMPSLPPRISASGYEILDSAG